MTQRDLKEYYRFHQYCSLTKKDEKSKQKYSEIYKLEIDWDENKYSLSFQSLVDHKIIDLQYRILHRYLGTNKLLFKIGGKSSPSCERCMFQIETIEHIFYECFEEKKILARV